MIVGIMAYKSAQHSVEISMLSTFAQLFLLLAMCVRHGCARWDNYVFRNCVLHIIYYIFPICDVRASRVAKGRIPTTLCPLLIGMFPDFSFQNG